MAMGRAGEDGTLIHIQIWLQIHLKCVPCPIAIRI